MASIDFPSDQQRRPDQPQTLGRKWRVLLSAGAYLLFFVPLLVERSDPSFRFHARQGLGLAGLWVAAWGFHRLCTRMGVPELGWVLPAGCLILTFFGVYRALGLESRPLPYVGSLFDRIPLWRNEL